MILVISVEVYSTHKNPVAAVAEEEFLFKTGLALEDRTDIFPGYDDI